jgi:uncharacterized protein YigA (DUF484 family)
MSNQVRGLPAAENPEDQLLVVQYLHRNPDFFERHPQLLARMRLQHPRNGAATVSLIERQVEVLREKQQAQEQKLAEFVQIARAYTVLADKVHRFTRRLLRTRDAAHFITEIEASLREDFDTFHAVLVLTQPREYAGASQPFVRRVDSTDPTYLSFESLFATCKPRCGQIRDSQREFLFGNEAPSIGSVALVPLNGTPPPGLLALGSVDRDRFHPGMSTEFLTRLGEIITDVLSR